MREYVLKRTGTVPDWDSIPVLYIDCQRRENEDGVSAEAQLSWNDEAIHVRLTAHEKNIRCTLSGRTDPVWEDSCLEFFLRPTEDLHYFNFEFNPNCALYLGYETGKPDLTRLLPVDAEKLFAPEAERTEDGWRITYRVPFVFIQRFFRDFRPEPGLRFYGNLYKCGDRTVHPHYLTWNPVPEDRSFHSPEDFGRLILE